MENSTKCPCCGGQPNFNESSGMFNCPYCGAEFPPNESDAVKTEKIRTQAYKDIENEKIKWGKEQEKARTKKAEAEAFKKGKFIKVLVVFTVLGALMGAVGFNDGRVLAGIVGLVITALFICSILMGLKAVDEPFKGSRMLSAVLAFVLIIPYFNIYNPSRSHSYNPPPEDDYSYDFSSEPSTTPSPVTPDDTENVDATDDSSLPTANTDGEAVSEEESVPSLSFILEAGEPGEYGRMVTYNKGTEFEENFYAYYVPVGEYRVTNIGSHMSAIYVYSDEKHKNDAGWEEAAESFEAKVLDVNKSAEISVGEKQHIEIIAPYLFLLEKIDSAPTDSDSPETDTPEPEETDGISDGTIRPEFKQALDGYEKFFDDYVEFMKKYNKSNGTDLSLITEYADFMTKYADNLSKLDELEGDEDLTVAEAAYLAEVSARIIKKLSQIAQ